MASINVLQTYTTVGNDGVTPSAARGMCFKIPSDGNIYLAVIDNCFLGLDKTTGAVQFATDALGGMFKADWNPGGDTFLGSPAGGAPHFTVGLFDGGGGLASRPVSGPSPYAQIIIDGNYFAGNTFDTKVTVLDAGSGAPVAQIDTTVAAPGNDPGQWATDGTSIWTSNGTKLIRIDAAGATLVSVIDLAGQGVGTIVGLVFISGFLYVSDRTTANLWKINPFTGIAVGGVVGAFTGPLVFDGTYLWQLDPFANLVAVYEFPSLAFQAATGTTGASAQDIAFDPADGPGIIWATSSSTPDVVEQFQFIPDIPPASSPGAFPGTFSGFILGSQFGGGTK